MLIQNAISSVQTAQPSAPSSDAPAAAGPDIQMPSVTQVAVQTAVQTPAPTASQLQSAIQNTNLALSGKGLEFSVDTATRQTVVKLMDTKTGDVIGQFPSQQMLDISKAIGLMQEQLQQASPSRSSVPTATGLLIKQQA